MAITFKYAVKYNGKYYPANTPIEEAAENERPAAASKTALPQKATEGPQSDVIENPTANTTGTEKTEQGKKAGRQRAKKGTGDAK